MDLSAAFDTIDHPVLLQRLEHRFGVSGTARSWFRFISDLSDRQQLVSINGIGSRQSVLGFGVHQGSVLAPILFLLYTQPLSQILTNLTCPHQMFADDTQLRDPGISIDFDEIKVRLQTCASVIKEWMLENNFSLSKKTLKQWYCFFRHNCKQKIHLKLLRILMSSIRWTKRVSES